MSIRILALLLALSSVCLQRSAAQTLLMQSVDFSCESCLPADALVQLSRQTGINIVFSDRFFSRCQPLSIQVRQETFAAVLDKITACTKVSYKVLDNQIVFYRRTQKYTLSGYVQDAETGERLIGAGVRVLSEKNLGAVSNEFGFFSLSLDEGEHTIVVNYIGYRLEEINLSLTSDRILKVPLQPNNALPEVVVSALPRLQGEPLRSHESRQNLPLSALQSLPMPGGEADLLRLTALQTGVQTGVDGLGGLHIRGGNADQNLVLLDDVPVYNPSHALGLFSIFNPATVSNAKLWKGDFPARYGGRVSSVLDVRTRDGNFRDYQAHVSIGLVASSLALEGPIVKDKSSFLFGVRGTYFEPWVKFFSKRSNLLTFSGDKLGYRFFDTNLKLNYVFSERNRLYFSYYQGGDQFENQFNQRYVSTEGVLTDRYTLGSSWGNAIAALRWNHLLRKNLFTNTTLRFSRFIYQSQLTFNSSILYPNGKQNQISNYGQLYQTLISDWSGKTDFSYFASDRLTMRWGVSYTLHNFQPGALAVNFLQPGQSPLTIDSLAEVLLNNERLGADESEAYLDVEWKPFPTFLVAGGVNASVFQIRQINYPNLLPRLRLRRDGRRGWSQWVSYAQMAQNLHQIGSFNISLPFELWVPSTAKVEPEKVWQAAIGVGWQRNGWNWQIENYYKRLDRVLTFLSSNDALFVGGAEDASGWEDRITAGTGYSRGTEILVEKTSGPTSGSIAYTYSQSVRQFPDLNAGRPFPFRFDRRHDLKIALKQRVCSWLDADATWVFATGNPITLAGVKYTHHSPNSDVEREVYVYTQVNGYRLPNYHRLDLAFNAHFAGRRARHSIQLGVFNVYNRANPFFLFVDAGSGVQGKAIQYTLLPLLPSFRYELKL